ncbi:glycosyltransferase [Shewanella baltica]|uniref:glycosyltransferase n=1 Tax=Shewanella baltica TaxID=62322 RepID=UPI00217D776C|nr:glycosyltransferase [Shewanella baltica]MCS6098308.1 glycosyltransferase [Shewanella baltica]MCS6181494.1 glycosyltransferase [Shewanella baltica]
MNENITFIIFTYNEEKRIERVIKNLHGHGKILIADNKSTDNTLAIAKSYGCDIYIRDKTCVYVETAEMMAALKQEVTTDWVYWGFADEMLELKTLNEMNRLIVQDNYDVISIDRKNYYWGRFCYDAYASRTNKIFKVDAINFEGNKIHGFGKLSSDSIRVYDLPSDYFVHHFISNNIESYLNTINRYTNIEASTAIASNYIPFRIVKLISSAIINQFFMKNAYKAGTAGLALVCIQTVYSVINLLKSIEINQNLVDGKIEMLNNMKREEIISYISENGDNE